MASIIKVDGQDLLVILEFDDNEFEKITMCINKKREKVFIINGKIVSDEKIVDRIKKKYNLELPEEYKNVVY